METNVTNKNIVVDDMFLTTDRATTAGSKMLEGYMSLFESEAISRLKQTGYIISEKTEVGEFAIDVLGETSASGMIISQGVLKNASAEIIKSGKYDASLCLDVNGSVRRAAAQSGLVSIKPTYGTVSRYGIIPVVCSGETVSVLADSAASCRNVLGIIAGHDDKDGTSLPDALCNKLKSNSGGSAIRRVAFISNMANDVDNDVQTQCDKAISVLKHNGIEVTVIDNSVITTAKTAWNVLMSAELCNNVSRYDGVKYGYRAQSFLGIDELYTNSRTEAFGELIKTAIIFGSDALSTNKYMKVYDKCLRMRRIIAEEFSKLFSQFDAVVMPACSAMSYSVEKIAAKKFFAFEENFYTAPASITGLPAVVSGGVQIIGPAFSDLALLDVAEIIEKEVG